MGSKDEKPHSPEESVLEESHVVQELRRRLAEPGPWPRCFRRLAKAIAATPIPRQDSTPGLSCWECEDLLDLCVDDELQGHDVQQLYPLVQQHLRICPRCREAHDLLADVLKLERHSKLSCL